MVKNTKKSVKKEKAPAAKKKTESKKQTPPAVKKTAAAKKTAEPLKQPAAAQPDEFKFIKNIFSLTSHEESILLFLKNIGDLYGLDHIHLFRQSKDKKAAHLTHLLSGGNFYSHRDLTSPLSIPWNALPDQGCFENLKSTLFSLNEEGRPEEVKSGTWKGLCLRQANSYMELCIIALSEKKCTEKSGKSISALLPFLSWIATSDYFKTENDFNKNTSEERFSEIKNLEKEIKKQEGEIQESSLGKESTEQELRRIQSDFEALQSEFKKTADDLREARNNLNETSRLLSEETSEKNKTRENLSLIQKELDELNSSFASLKESEEKLKQEVADRHQISEKLNLTKKELDELNSSFAGLKESEEKLKQEVADRHQISEKLNQTKKELDELNFSFASLKESEEKLKQEAADRHQISEKLNQTKKELDELNSRYENHKKSLSEREKESENTIQSLKAEIENITKTSNLKTSEINSTWQNKYDNLLKEKEAVNDSFEKKVRETAEKASRISDLEKKLEQKNQESDGLSREIENLKTFLESENKKHEKDLADLMDELEKNENQSRKIQDDLSNDLRSKEEQISSLSGSLNEARSLLEEKTKSFEQQLQEKESLMHSQKIEFNELSEMLENQIKHEKDRQLKDQEEFQINLEKKESEIAGHKKQIEELKASIQKLNSSLDLSHQNIQDLEARIKEHQNKEKTLNSSIAELENEKSSLLSSIASLNQNIENLKNQITIHKGNEQKLSAEISNLKENIRNLENAVQNEIEEKAALSGEISRLKQGLSDAETAIEEKNLEIHNRKNEIFDLKKHEKKLNEELETARQKEKNSKEKGRLLEKIIFSLTDLSDLPLMLTALNQHLADMISADRIAIYSLQDEKNLRIMAAVTKETELKELQDAVIPLNQTPFGQTFASQKSMIADDSLSLTNADLPGISGNYFTTESSAVIPLTVSGKSLGVLTLGSKTKNYFSENNIQIYNSIAPLIARTLLFHLNQENLSHYSRQGGYLSQIEKLIKHRFNQTALRIQGLQSASEELSLSVYENIPEQRKSEDDFSLWIEKLSEIIASRLSSSNTIDIDRKTATILKQKTDAYFEYLFWFLAEASDNIIKHSDANDVLFSLKETDGNIELIVSDNGEGLMRTAGTESPANGTGLAAMQAAVELSGGIFSTSKRKSGYGLEITAIWKI